MRRGVLVIRGDSQVVYMPVFHPGRESAYAILADAMERWQPSGTRDPFYDRLEFYRIAETVGKERTGADRFLGPEMVPLGSHAEIVERAVYVFEVDFAGRRVVRVK